MTHRTSGGDGGGSILDFLFFYRELSAEEGMCVLESEPGL